MSALYDQRAIKTKKKVAKNQKNKENPHVCLPMLVPELHQPTVRVLDERSSLRTAGLEVQPKLADEPVCFGFQSLGEGCLLTSAHGGTSRPDGRLKLKSLSARRGICVGHDLRRSSQFHLRRIIADREADAGFLEGFRKNDGGVANAD